MLRFIVLYTLQQDTNQYYSEGLIHMDRSAYLRGIKGSESVVRDGLYELKCYLRDHEDIRSYHIQMIDGTPNNKD